MAQVTQNTFERLSLEITDIAERLALFSFLQLRHINERVIIDPDAIINIQRETNRLVSNWHDYVNSAEGWMDEELAQSYLRGIERANSNIPPGVLTTGVITGGLLTPNVMPAPLSARAASILSAYPDHHTMYGAFRQAVDNDIRATRVPIVRQQQGRIREIMVMAGEDAYRGADTFTRRQMSQDLMRRFTNEGVTGIIYRDGRRMGIDTYSEMVARTMTQQAFNQANWNRLQEHNQDLTVISVHYPCSDLCEPYQGRVFSISGTSREYQPLMDALDGLVFRPNCGHHTSGYTPGQKTPDRDISTAENRKMYEAQQHQRYNERQIRKWKRREVASVDPKARRAAKKKISAWQKRQREHLTGNSFLRRDYTREGI